MTALGVVHSESASSFGVQRSDKSVVLPSIYGGSINTISGSSLPSLALLFPDTAPRPQWRPQVEAWLRKARLNHGHPYARVKTNDTPSYLSTNHYNSSSYSNPRLDHDYQPTLSVTGAAAALANISSSASLDVNVPIQTSTTTTTTVRAANTEMARHDKSSSSDDNNNNKRKSSGGGAKTARSPSRSPNGNNKRRPSPSSSTSSRRCISCGCDQSPCWRPSWSPRAGQLCNSCGLRYKKTGARCISADCGRIPAKGEWISMKASQVHGRYMCFYCGGPVAVGESSQSSNGNVHNQHHPRYAGTSAATLAAAAATSTSPFGDSGSTRRSGAQLGSPAIPPIGNQITPTAIRS